MKTKDPQKMSAKERRLFILEWVRDTYFLTVGVRHVSLIGICSRLKDFHGENYQGYHPVFRTDRDYLLSYIDKQLGHKSWLFEWMLAQPQYQNLKFIPVGKLRDARLAWLNWMIDCYKEDIAKGTE